MWLLYQIGKQQACLSLGGLRALGKILHHEIKQTVCLLFRTLNDMSQELDALNQELSEVRGNFWRIRQPLIIYYFCIT